MAIPYGVSSMVAPLEQVLVQAPTEAFGTAFDDPRHGYLHAVDIDRARKEHELFCELLDELGTTVHHLDTESSSPDLVYTYDPSFMTPAGAILLRSGKASRLGEEDIHAEWYRRQEVPIVGQIEAPGTVDGGDMMWLAPDLLVVGRSLRTNQAGIDQIRCLIDAHVAVFDVPVHHGPAACLHLMSSISMVADDLAVVDTPLLPAGLVGLLHELEVESIEVGDGEVETLGANILAVSPGVAVVAEGNPSTSGALASKGVDVHTFSGAEIAVNGTGGPTCLTRPLCRT